MSHGFGGRLDVYQTYLSTPLVVSASLTYGRDAP